jgi:actin-related protein
MHNMIVESINKCDVDLRKELLSNIVLTGGNTLFGGLPETMQKKLIDIGPQVILGKFSNSLECQD